MMTLNHIHRKCTAGYKLNKTHENISHLMYIDDIKLFAKTEKKKKIGNTHANRENIQSRYRNAIWHKKCASNEKWQTTHNGRTGTTKSSNQNAWRKENLQILGDIGS